MNGDAHADGARALCVTADADTLDAARAQLGDVGFVTRFAASARSAVSKARDPDTRLVVVDLSLGERALELSCELATTPGAPPVVTLAPPAALDLALRSLRCGARACVPLPLDPGRLSAAAREAWAAPTPPAPPEEGFEGFIGESPPMLALYDRLRRLGRSEVTVLITGESGSGKELAARALHRLSPRATGPFVPTHLGAIPTDLVASELFGHERGAFTGAVDAAPGRFDIAARGTLFLDEVATMDAAVQVTLLRVLETFRYTRVGGRRERVADVRVVAATNRDLSAMVAEGSFREDLYYRLNVAAVAMPPLRERPSDVRPLAEHFLRRFSERFGTPARRLTAGAVARLEAHRWPGNVRELCNLMEQAAVFSASEVLDVDDLWVDPRARRAASVAPGPEPTLSRPDEAVRVEAGSLVVRPGATVEAVERALIFLTLDATEGNKLRAARALGLSRRSLYNKLQAYARDEGNER
ncbi:MAG: sigma-54 dependent transcriptional regulator [Polyangiales bacterium]